MYSRADVLGALVRLASVKVSLSMLDYAVVWEWVDGGRGELEEKKVFQRLLLEDVNDLVNTVVGLGNSGAGIAGVGSRGCLLYTSPSPRD